MDIDNHALLSTGAFHLQAYAVFILAPAGIITWSNLGAQKLYGYAPEELVDTPFASLLAEAGLLHEALTAAAAHGTYTWQGWHILKDKSMRWVHSTLSPIPDGAPQPDGYLLLCQDQTKQYQHTLHRKQLEERLNHVLEGAHAGIWDVDIRDNHCYWSPRFIELFGIPADKPRTLATALECIHPEDRQPLVDKMQAHIEGRGEYEVEYRIVLPSGKLRYCLSRGSAIKDAQGEVTRIVGAVIDITQQKLAEAEIKRLHGQLEKRFYATFQQVAVGFAHTNLDCVWERVNTKLCEILGYSEAELQKMTFMEVTHPDDLAADLQLVERVLKGESTTYALEKRFIRKDGTILWANLTVTLVRDNANNPDYFISVIEDISERKRTQEALLETAKRFTEELERRVAERTQEIQAINKELEAFSYSVSHDLRAPLRSIDGFSNIIASRYADKLDEQGKEYFKFIRDNTQRMGQLIDDLLQLSRLSRAELNQQETNLSAIAEDVIAGLKVQLPERSATFKITPNLMAVGDPHLLRVVLVNLLENAWKFTLKTPEPLIEFSVIEENNQRIFWVRDNGAGFDMKFAPKLFGAFQRLHSMTEFPGTGIGLATVQRIIHRHLGRVWATAEVGKGATFYFTLGTH